MEKITELKKDFEEILEPNDKKIRQGLIELIKKMSTQVDGFIEIAEKKYPPKNHGFSSYNLYTHYKYANPVRNELEIVLRKIDWKNGCNSRFVISEGKIAERFFDGIEGGISDQHVCEIWEYVNNLTLPQIKEVIQNLKDYLKKTEDIKKKYGFEYKLT